MIPYQDTQGRTVLLLVLMEKNILLFIHRILLPVLATFRFIAPTGIPGI